ncbi:MAG: cob(I)yrinic acid a,c-diamide adenosyltransferase, partial [Lachnospiraceae bacterium]|nr:cob(I)yrinic acid a,c-diamide adenosyltransferase [Lachnospiraceae bacterium]
QHKPRGLEIVMTGPRLPDNLLEMADYVTEVRKVKHQFDLGRSARKGIEF